jgi:hypothetical protein
MVTVGPRLRGDDGRGVMLAPMQGRGGLRRPFSPAISIGGYGDSEPQSRLGEIAGEGQDKG